MSSVLLSGKTAVVTGASSGIGRAIAEKLGAEGAHVFLAGRSAAPMEAAAKRIQEVGGRASVAVLDVRDPKQVQDLIDSAVRETGRLDIMVNNAGLSHPTPIVDAEPEEWRAMLETNVLALLVGCQAAVRAMRACKAEGHVVNISSIAAHRADSGVYGATKHAVNCISATLRRELEEDTIRVVNVMPGAVATNFARNFDPEFLAGIIKATGMEVKIRRGEKLPDEVLEKLQPMMRQLLAAPEDVAAAVLYAVTQPVQVNVSEIVVRPPKQLNL
jgi:NADP-dependent 3-hydroxy acid dehydrogenase YdfG